MQYIPWPPFPRVETAMKNAWLADVGPAFHSTLAIALFVTLPMLPIFRKSKTGAADPPDLLAHNSWGSTCSEWRRCKQPEVGSDLNSITYFARDKAPFPAATSAPEFARLFSFGKTLAFT
ncbi:hypothetical protein BDP27DRAFT_1423679 [Rhodocollybia butyracea]|uniref:Uncharacterized protein n=1 Tax=Rhodocollybia butyracea TaxID=206335 RepID=A0A9P5PRH5_9AGAR|nr:hypothetical protein BDP27DRAFT_1423679 [Rhodocollybia butyracea]